jgi:predicted nucleic acid-binding protein
VTYLVDANVLSEATKPDPSGSVLAWLRATSANSPWTRSSWARSVSAFTCSPQASGGAVSSAGSSRGFATLVCLPWDAATGLRWAELLADLRRAGLAMSLKDSMIAATALVHHLTVATHNQKDFKKAGVKVVDPLP